jgi:hypothetical protein
MLASIRSLATDLFPGGRPVKPHEAAAEVDDVRFVAPGAPHCAGTTD